MTDYHGNDIYCDVIIPGHVQVDVVEETAGVLAYRHTNPYWPTHVVVVPKTHVASLLDLEGNLAQEFFAVLKRVGGTITRTEGGAQVMTNLGDYQSSKHLHVHVYHGARIR